MSAGAGKVDVSRNLRMILQHVLICGPDDTVQRAIEQVEDAVRQLVEIVDRATVDSARVEYDAGPAVYEIAEDDLIEIRAAFAAFTGVEVA